MKQHGKTNTLSPTRTFTSLLFATLLALALTGCPDGSDDGATSPPEDTEIGDSGGTAERDAAADDVAPEVVAPGDTGSDGGGEPETTRWCAPCSSDEDCADEALPGAVCRELEGTGAWFCMSPCDQGGASCPAGATCETVAETLLCVPPDGTCGCAPEHEGRSGRCDSEGCTGTVRCEGGVLTECDAASSEEICNGVDDDCDGDVDEDADESCDDGVGCTADQCVGGECVYAPAAGTCLIGVSCYSSGERSPVSECKSCQPSANPSGWTSLDGPSCDDGDACTVGDLCVVGQCVSGSAADCDDGLTCTEDGCDTLVGCVSTPLDDTECDDSDACTIKDTCQDGGCVGVAKPCVDALACTIDTCVEGVCDSSTLVGGTCLIGASCVAEGFASPASSCVRCLPAKDPHGWSDVDDGAPCGDGNACTVADACVGGECAGVPLPCDDGQECTLDFCVALVGCQHPGVTGLDCDDGDPCTTDDECLQTTCVGGSAVSCDDNNPCTVDACVPPSIEDPVGGCQASADPQATTCDDGDPCTTGDVCSNGACGGAAKDCGDGVECTDDECEGGDCVSYVAVDACLIGDVCFDGGTPDPLNPCALCDPDEDPFDFVPASPGTPCADGDGCTVGELCQGGGCVGATTVDCDDGKSCTSDACVAGAGEQFTCEHLPLDGPCNDGDPCTVGDACAGGGCTGAPRDCTFLNGECVVGECQAGAGGCAPTPLQDGTTCSDSNPCTGPDQCLAGECAGPAQQACCQVDLDCEDGNACTVDSCEVGSGVCTNDPAPMQGQGCEDGKWCTVEDACTAAGSCVGEPRVCQGNECAAGVCDEQASACGEEPLVDGTPCTDDGSGCTDDICKAGACAHPNNASACDDGEGCTFNDGCHGGVCAGTPYDCDDEHACTLRTCLGDGTCEEVLEPETCFIEGECRSSGEPSPIDPCMVCDPDQSPTSWVAGADGVACAGDGDPCTDDVCQLGVCEHPHNAASCNDGNACTTGDACAAGTCAGKVYVCDDGLPCTTDACDGAGGCVVELQPGFCRIEGACYLSGLESPTNPCLACEPDSNPAAWTQRPDGTGCSDGSACTAADGCAGGVCKGAPIDCDDGNVCTEDSCAQGTGCSYTPNTIPCNDGAFCTVNDTCTGGGCGGAPRDCSGDTTQCTVGTCNDVDDACVPVAVTNGTQCDDGAVCTGSDACGSGICKGVLLADCCTQSSDCDDDNPCTQDSCDPGSGQCSNTPGPLNGTSCQDGHFCTTDDKCTGGTCVGKLRDCAQVADECNLGLCDEAANACVKNPTNEGQACSSDGIVCTDDLCVGGTCQHIANSAPCDDGELCTHSDSCNGGFCFGVVYTCSDGLACTSDQCDGAGLCEFLPDGSSCVIGGVCHAKGASKPGQPCLVCDPDANPSSWSVAPAGSACEDGDSCTTGDSCLGEVCVPGPSGCLPCLNEPEGSPCDDSDAATVGDICLKGLCAGFTIHHVQPTGAGASPRLGKVTHTGGAFYATGSDNPNSGGRGWVAQISGGEATVVSNTVRNGEEYSAISRELAVTRSGTILIQQNGTWTEHKGLNESFAGLSKPKPSTIAAGWSAVDGSNRYIVLAGYDNPAWVVGCGIGVTPSGCRHHKVPFGDWPSERPRAITGFGELSGTNAAAVTLAMVADFAGNQKWYNDAFRRFGSSVDSVWSDTYVDYQVGPQIGADVHGTSDGNAWWGGTHGLLRGRWAGFEGNSWTDLPDVLNNQEDYDLNGVWVDTSVVLYAADRRTENGSQQKLTLVTHDLSTDHFEGDDWFTIELMSLPLDTNTDCEGEEWGAECDTPDPPGSVVDVWYEAGTLILTGWTEETLAGGTQGLIIVRQPTASTVPIEPFPP